jgi:hypothetical protein
VLHLNQTDTVLQDIMVHVSNDLAARAFASDPMSNSKEAKCREIISPLLFAAAILAEVQLHAEYAIVGRRAHGYVDWGMVSGNLAVVVVEVRPLCVIPLVCSFNL